MPSRQMIMRGKVQGVGFRPFVFRLAHALKLNGWVKNSNGRVELLVQGEARALDTFQQALIEQAPPLAEPVLQQMTSVDHPPCTSFTIVDSDREQAADIHIPADYFTCDACLAELMDPNDRRYRYPFINCTNCGPRYTLIERLPYDRPNTSMKIFPLCDACKREYGQPLDRRFHAQPLACEQCGPRLHIVDGEQQINGNEACLQYAVQALRAGKILAVKGIGGYHLMCDACNSSTVARLRERKRRPHKPFAVLFSWQGVLGDEQVLKYLQPDEQQRMQLRHASRAIVLVPCRDDSSLAHNVHPGLHEVGAMLPYSPLHHLLSHDFGGPLVATSANFSGEPVLTDNDEAQQRLAPIVDLFLHHDRPIVRPADDSVIRMINRKPHYLRLGRGAAPLELTLPFELQHPTLAVGGHMKNTIALGWHNRLVMSPHIGDLSSLRGMRVFEQVIDDLQSLYQQSPQLLVCDAHPDYASHRWAQQHCEQHGKTLLPVFHHHAHAAALCGEFTEPPRWLVFTWDGTGYGEDGSIWGGEALLGYAGHWQRVAHFKPLSLLGGDRASMQPWRSAAALCWAAGMDYQPPVDGIKRARQAWHQRQGCFTSSAAGRIFDAAAALILDIQQCSFDGQAPMLLEQVCESLNDRVPRLTLADNDAGLLEADWSTLLPALCDARQTPAQRSTLFHSAMAHVLIDQALNLRERHGDFTVGLSGGVFQNKKLSEYVSEQLRAHGFIVHGGDKIPCNDAGISYGQIIEAHHRLVDR